MAANGATTTAKTTMAGAHRKMATHSKYRKKAKKKRI